MNSQEEAILKEDVRLLSNAVFGSRENPKDSPGVLSQLARTNEILTELSDSVRWITRLILGGFVTGLLVVLWKVGAGG
jgi:hypothetical protein